MINTKDENPCYGCTERVLGCHSTCERYKERKAKYDERKRKFIEQRNEEGIYESYRRIKLARYRHTRDMK